MANFDVNRIVVGDCDGTSSGSISLQAIPNENTTGSFTYEWTVPPLGSGPARYSLAAGQYQIRVSDSTSPIPITETVVVEVSSGSCASIVSVVDASCGEDNGTMTISGTTSLSSNVMRYELFDNDGDSVNSVTVPSSTYTFTSLPSGIYHATVTDDGGCTGTTQNCIVRESNDIEFGGFVIPESSCSEGGGSIRITGLTNAASYFFSWSDATGQPLPGTTNELSGLTAGQYIVSVTSPAGCVVSEIYEVGISPPMIMAFTNVTNPSCFDSDGGITVSVNGGTSPYFYSGSNGQTMVTYDNNFTFTGLTQGLFSTSITDVTLCTETLSTFLISPNSFGTVSISKVNAGCSENSGSISISVSNGQGQHTFHLSGTTEEMITTTSPDHTFNNLAGGDYIINVSGNATECVFSQVVTIEYEPPFNLQLSVSGATCGRENGAVTVTVGSGSTAPYQYHIQGDELDLFQVSNEDEYMFTDLPHGEYKITVKDGNSCSRTLSFIVVEEPRTSFILFPSPCGPTGLASLTALITSGTPPFTIEWNPSVSSSFHASGLTNGTYAVTVTDSNGCVDQREMDIDCSNMHTYSEDHVMCISIGKPVNVPRIGLVEILNQGFMNATSGQSGCVLVSATTFVTVTANSASTTEELYTSTALNDVLGEEEFYEQIKTILLSIPGIGSVEVDLSANTIRIFSDCSLDNELDSPIVTISINIIYDILCPET